MRLCGIGEFDSIFRVPRREITHDAGRREMINSCRFIDTRDVATTKLLACPLVPLKYLA